MPKRLHLLPFATLLLLLPASLFLFGPPTSILSKETTPLPLIIWHGLGDRYDSDGLQEVGELAQEVNPGTFVYQIRLHEDGGTDSRATFIGNLTEQLAQVCEDLSTHPILSTAPAVNALGFSQGGQFLRAYVERCNNPPVRSLVTFGSQHNGISKYQDCGASDWLCKAWIGILKSNTWGHLAQSTLVPAQYFRSTNDTTNEPTDDYLEYSNFLADINNERALKNVTYAKHIAELESFVMYLFEDDTTVIPKESGWFAQTNLENGTVTPLKERAIYKEDWIGLKALDEKGGLYFKTTKGPHMQLSDKVLKEVFGTFYASGWTWKGLLGKAQEIVDL
ncbi:alpha/beta-hydrolase [Amniculicola lignicola CBS 123094]|uniref:Palmitoyl-protein thioesterase 1 n=1 Tax=Amniculicola lignicola CBS 123094 TaxID=1392246 RepID=A0A6A5W482_9PLEO|nr:alpha/beta-hydrolase [Amniculicola lignicola CBS 123094]